MDGMNLEVEMRKWEWIIQKMINWGNIEHTARAGVSGGVITG